MNRTYLFIFTLLAVASLSFAGEGCGSCESELQDNTKEKNVIVAPDKTHASNNCCQPGKTPDQDKQPGGEMKMVG